MMDYTMTGEGATGAPTVPALADLRDALDELMARAEDLDGISEGTHHALERAAEALKSDHGALQAVMAARAARMLSEPFDARAGFLFDEEEGDGDDDLETLSHDLDSLGIQAGDLVGRGLLSGSTRALLEHAAHLLRADLAAADSGDGETVQASEWDGDEDDAEEEGADLWPDADALARRRYGVSLDQITLADPDIMQRLLYEAERRRRA